MRIYFPHCRYLTMETKEVRSFIGVKRRRKGTESIINLSSYQLKEEKNGKKR